MIDVNNHDWYVVPPSLTPANLGAYSNSMKAIAEAYNAMIEGGIPNEDARMILPNACKSNIVVTMNARELMHFFNLRCCTRAQWEIRELAYRMLEECKKTAPNLFKHAGAQCETLGYCPEHKGCGKYPTLVKPKV